MKRNKREEEEIYRLTLKGMLGEDQCAMVIRAMRHFGDNAIVLNDEGELEWAFVEKVPPQET